MYGIDWDGNEVGIVAKFKIGDRVRVVDSNYVGKVFQITDVDDNMGVTSYWVLPHGYCFQEERLELAPDCAERKVEQDNAPAMDAKQPKFKAGDVVRSNINDDLGAFKIGDILTITRTDHEFIVFTDKDGDERHQHNADFSLAIPHIVALVKNGKPLPSRYPHVHASVEDATAEAERLARNNPGQEFAVYQRVTARVAEVHYSMKEVA